MTSYRPNFVINHHNVVFRGYNLAKIVPRYKLVHENWYWQKRGQYSPIYCIFRLFFTNLTSKLAECSWSIKICSVDHFKTFLIFFTLFHPNSVGSGWLDSDLKIAEIPKIRGKVIFRIRNTIPYLKKIFLTLILLG